MLPKNRYNSPKKVGRQSANNDPQDQQSLYDSRVAVARQREKMCEKMYRMMQTMGCPSMMPTMGCPSMMHTMGCPSMMHTMGCPSMMQPMMVCPSMIQPMMVCPTMMPTMGYPTMMPTMGCPPMYPMMPEHPSTLVESSGNTRAFNRSSKLSEFRTLPSEDSEQREKEINEWLDKRKETGNSTPVSTTQSGSQSSCSFDDDPRYVLVADPSISRTWNNYPRSKWVSPEDAEDTIVSSEQTALDLIVHDGQVFEF